MLRTWVSSPEGCDLQRAPGKTSIYLLVRRASMRHAPGKGVSRRWSFRDSFCPSVKCSVAFQLACGPTHTNVNTSVIKHSQGHAPALMATCNVSMKRCESMSTREQHSQEKTLSCGMRVSQITCTLEGRANALIHVPLKACIQLLQLPRLFITSTIPPLVRLDIVHSDLSVALGARRSKGDTREAQHLTSSAHLGYTRALANTSR
jgi:hypothetical protein